LKELNDYPYLNAEHIGKNFSVFHEVTLGITPGKGKPWVGDNVTIYMGAQMRLLPKMYKKEE